MNEVIVTIKAHGMDEIIVQGYIQDGIITIHLDAGSVEYEIIPKGVTVNLK